jgi:hypothetical protein
LTNELDLEILKQHPNAEIVYILHEKFIINDPSNENERQEGKEKIMKALHNITWITYRSFLERPLLNSTYKSDAGWGCMIRTGQMLLFQAL